MHQQNVTSRDWRIEMLTNELVHLPQVDCLVEHAFTPGLYARTINVPTGVCLVGLRHRVDSMVIVSQGTMRLLVDGGYEDCVAPTIRHCKAETVNAGYALSDCVWTNIFATDCTDTEELVERLTYGSKEELLGGSRNIQLMATGGIECKT